LKERCTLRGTHHVIKSQRHSTFSLDLNQSTAHLAIEFSLNALYHFILKLCRLNVAQFDSVIHSLSDKLIRQHISLSAEV